MLPGSPRYSREGRGGLSHRGSRAALEVPVQEEDDAEPPAMPQPGAQSPWGTRLSPVPSTHTTHRLPFGSGKPSGAAFPLKTLWRKKRGAAGGLLRSLPGAVPTWQHGQAECRARGPGRSPWGLGSPPACTGPSLPGTSRHRGGPARHPAGLPPPMAPARYTGLNAQAWPGTLTPRHRSPLPVPPTPWPAGKSHGQPRCHRAVESSALGGAAWGAQLPAPWPLPRTHFRPQLQPGATRCLPVLPG